MIPCPYGLGGGLTLWTQIHDNIYQGGCRGGFDLPHEFRHVVSMYPWEQYNLGPNTDRVEYEFYDSPDQDLAQVVEIAKEVNRLSLDGPTLVHCQQGLNRSGVVVATALVQQGVDPVAAIINMRRIRHYQVLSNWKFERFVMDLPQWVSETEPPFLVDERLEHYKEQMRKYRGSEVRDAG